MPEENATPPAPKPPEAPKAPEGPKPEAKKDDMPPEPKWLFYVLSLVVSIFGIIFGIIYLTKEGAENKKFGKICLILGIVMTVLPCICWAIAVFGFGMLGGISESSTYYSY